MASTMTSIITGPVLAVERRSGTAKATGNPYDFTQVRVLVADRGLCEYSMPSGHAALPSAGDMVSVVVETEVYGPNLSTRYSAEYAG